MRSYFFIGYEGLIIFKLEHHALTRSQDLEEAYHDAGMFYWCSFKLGLEGSNKGAIVISERQSQDIDTFEDWEIAELKYKILK